MKFTDIFVRRPVLALVVSLLILLIGGMSMLALPIRQYPRLYNTTITVTTSYPGASPDLIQGFITTPIEQAVSSAEGIDYLTSSSTQSTSTVTAYVKLNYDPNQALTDVMAKVQQVKYLMPTQAQDPIILKSTGQTTAVMYIGFASDELSSAAISDYLTRVVQPLLATVEGVASADILGGQTFAMRLWLDPVRMAAHNISANDVNLAIRANNYQSAPGQAKGFYTVTNISADTGLTDINQFKRMVVKAANGAVVRLEDIATVELGAQNWNSSVMMNGQQAIFIGVQATPTGNPLTIVKGVRALMPEIKRNLPPSMKMQVAYDSTKFIQASIDEVQTTLAEAVAIVVVVIFLFLGSFRSVLIPIVTIPLSLIGAGDHHGGDGVQPEPADPAGDGAGDRAGRRRRDRRARKRLPPYRGGQERGAGGADRRARDCRAGHLDDPDPGGGLCADRLSRRRHRHAVPRIRVHAGRRGHHLGHCRGDLVADDVLAACCAAR